LLFISEKIIEEYSLIRKKFNTLKEKENKTNLKIIYYNNNFHKFPKKSNIPNFNRKLAE
jgi:hypothetical protein